MEYRILKDYPYKNAYGQYAYSSAQEFYLNTGINSKEFDDDLYVIRENILVDGQHYNVESNFLYSPFYNIVVNQNTSGVHVVSTDECDSEFYFINPLQLNEDDFDSDIHCCINMQEFAEKRILLEFNIANNDVNTQIYYDKNNDNYKNSTAPNEIYISSSVSSNDNFLPTIEPIDDYVLSTIYIAEWGDETSKKDKETLISDFQNNKYQFQKSGIINKIKHFYQKPGVHKIKGFLELRTGDTSECPYILESYPTIKQACINNPACLNYKIHYSPYYDKMAAWYGDEIPVDGSHIPLYDNAFAVIDYATDQTEGDTITDITPFVAEDYCLRFGSTGDTNYEPWSMYESFTIVDYFEAKINLNVDEVYKDEFEEIGGTGFDYLPWPETYPIIGGVSDESKYINDVINIVNQNQFKETEVLDKQKALEALENDELGNHLGKVDLAQTRFFKGVYDMDQLLMIASGTYNSYYDIYDEVTNSGGYWDGITNQFPLESCIGLIFINDSTNPNLRDDCILEFNFGDSQDDNIIDTSGANNKGIITGDYSLQKPSKDIPLIKDDVMITPTTDSTDGAF